MKKLLDNKVVQVGLTAFLVMAACILFSYCLFKLSKIFSAIGFLLKIMMPLIYGLVLAYIMNPMVKFFERSAFKGIKKDTVKRNLSIFCSFVLVIGILVTIISIVIPQLLLSIQSIIVNAPEYFSSIEKWLMRVLNDNGFGKVVIENYDSISEYLETQLNNVVLPMASNAFTTLSTGIKGIVTFVFNLAIGLVFAIYILANNKTNGAGIRKMLYSFFNVDKVNAFIDETKHVNHVFGNFMIGKICDSMCFVFTCTLIFLLIFKYPYPLLIAVIIGLTDLIPYFGPYIGSVPAALLICLVNPLKAITFVLFMIILQQIDGNLVTPRIQKQATGLPSFWVLFAITLFGGLFGIVGLLVGVPCFTIIYEIINDKINKKLQKKNMPTDVDYYINLDGLEENVVKAK